LNLKNGSTIISLIDDSGQTETVGASGRVFNMVSGALNIGYYYATNELPGNIIQVLAMTSTYPDYFTNINTPGYGQCGDVPPL
jgi:hypothetical protein